jgi:C4-dicarboxylate-specific signal transduction histidine kinase
MADIAADILHNIGNILNSANISLQALEKMNISPSLLDLKRANQLLHRNKDSLKTFILEDPKGIKLLEYYPLLEKSLEEEIANYYADIKRLGEKLEMISMSINTQKNYVGIDSQTEQLELSQAVEDVLTIQSDLIERNGIRVTNHLKPMQSIPIQKVKLMHILTSIFKNSMDAMIDLPKENKEIVVGGEENDKSVVLRISDNGQGIKQENLKKIFTQGYTTKRGSQGFALHTCANYMADMSGSISAESDGIDQGATFVLSFTKQANEEEQQG